VSRGRCADLTLGGAVWPFGAGVRNGTHDAAHGVQQYVLLARRSGARNRAG
jgi:hypothetical protein